MASRGQGPFSFWRMIGLVRPRNWTSFVLWMHSFSFAIEVWCCCSSRSCSSIDGEEGEGVEAAMAIRGAQIDGYMSSEDSPNATRLVSASTDGDARLPGPMKRRKLFPKHSGYAFIYNTNDEESGGDVGSNKFLKK